MPCSSVCTFSASSERQRFSWQCSSGCRQLIFCDECRAQVGRQLQAGSMLLGLQRMHVLRSTTHV